MVRLTDLAPAEAEHIMGLELAEFESDPWVPGPPAKDRRVAIVTTAGLGRKGEKGFFSGAADYRVIPGSVDGRDLVLSHVSVNFDRVGFEHDANVVFPIDRLREMADEGAIGSVADYHYSFMGATDPRQMEPQARKAAGLLKEDRVNVVLLTPV